MELLVDFSYELSQKLISCKDPPYVTRFKKNGKELSFVSVQHGFGPESQNPHFQVIRKAVERDRPQVVLLESLPHSEGVNSTTITDMIPVCEKESFKSCPEIHFSASLARQQGVPFIGTELSEREILRSLEPEFSKSDYACFRWTVMLTFQGEEFSNSHPRFKFNREQFSLSLKEKLGVQFTYEDFLKCFKSVTKQEFDSTKLNTDFFRPDNSATSNTFQKIMYLSDRGRNPRMLRVISDTLMKYDKALVVLGWGHLVAQIAVLEDMLGPASFDCNP